MGEKGDKRLWASTTVMKETGPQAPIQSHGSLHDQPVTSSPSFAIYLINTEINFHSMAILNMHSSAV